MMETLCSKIQEQGIWGAHGIWGAGSVERENGLKPHFGPFLALIGPY